MNKKTETVKSKNDFVSPSTTLYTTKRTKMFSSHNIPPPSVVDKAERQAAFFDLRKKFLYNYFTR